MLEVDTERKWKWNKHKVDPDVWYAVRNTNGVTGHIESEFRSDSDGKNMK